jgi:hypothetical protein
MPKALFMHLVWHKILASDDALSLSSPSALGSISLFFMFPTPLATSTFFDIMVFSTN